MYRLLLLLSLITLLSFTGCATIPGLSYDLHPSKVNIEYEGNLPKINKKSTDTLILYIYSYVRDYFDVEYSNHKITLKQEGEECKWPSGHANKGTFTIGMGSKCTLNEQIVNTIIHETIHEVIGFTIKANPLDRDYSWLVEGFTSYFASRIGLEMGILSLDYFIKDHNTYMLAYQNHEDINVSEDEAIKSFEIDRSIHYRRGYALAFKWDMEIRARSKKVVGLKNYIKALLETSEESTIGKLDEVSTRFIKGGFGVDIIQYAQEGDTIPIVDFPEEGCIYSEDIDEGKIFKIDYEKLSKLGFKGCKLHI